MIKINLIKKKKDKRKRPGRFSVFKRARNERLLPRDIPRLFPPRKVKTQEEKEQLELDKVKFKETYLENICRIGRVKKTTKKYLKIMAATEKIIDALLVGAPFDPSFLAHYAGIKPSELREWIALGHTKPKSIYGAVLAQLQQAVSMCTVNDLKTIDQAAKGGEWEAAQARLKLLGFGKNEDKNRQPITVQIMNYHDQGQTISSQGKIISNQSMLESDQALLESDRPLVEPDRPLVEPGIKP